MAARSLICAQCGILFGCDRDGACWCMDETFRLPMPIVSSDGTVADCVCPTCLRAFADPTNARKSSAV